MDTPCPVSKRNGDHPPVEQGWQGTWDVGESFENREAPEFIIVATCHHSAACRVYEMLSTFVDGLPTGYPHVSGSGCGYPNLLFAVME